MPLPITVYATTLRYADAADISDYALPPDFMPIFLY